MEFICDKLASKIGNEMNFDKEKVKVIQYGMFAILQIVLSILLVLIVGRIFNVHLEALVIIFTSSLLRKFSGGAHASSPSACLFLGTIICVLLAKLAVVISTQDIEMVTIMKGSFLVLIWAVYIVCKRVPVDNERKRIRNITKRKKLRNKSLILIMVYFIFMFITFFFLRDKVIIYCYCICLGIVWQVFTLTKFGHNLISILDKIYIKLSK